MAATGAERPNLWLLYADQLKRAADDEQGFIKLRRGLKSHLSEMGPVNSAVFIFLTLRACHSGPAAGLAAASRRDVAHGCRISIGAATRALHWLQPYYIKEEQRSRHCEEKTVWRIVKWETVHHMNASTAESVSPRERFGPKPCHQVNGSTGEPYHHVNGSSDKSRISNQLEPPKNVNTEKNDKKNEYTRSTQRSASVRSSQAPEGFEEFYEFYPRKRSRRAAQKAWMSIGAHRDPALRAAVIDALRRSLPDFRSRPQDKVPYPATWLNAGGWEDEISSQLPMSATQQKTALEKMRERGLLV